MPLVTVIFNPDRVTQGLVDSLKEKLPNMVAKILSSDEVRIDTSSTEDIEVKATDIKVFQRMTHPTDMNVSSIMIYIEAGRQKGRSGEAVAKLLAHHIVWARIAASRVFYHNQCCIFITFHEHNGFQFIPRPE